MYAFHPVPAPLAISVRIIALLLLCVPASYAQPPAQIPHILEALVERWNKGIDHHNVALLKPCYDEQVMYHGEELSRESLLNAKKQFFYKYPGYRQYAGEVNSVHASNGVYRAYFEKTGLRNGKSVVQQGYLGFAVMEDGEFRIVEEGDAETEIAGHKAWSYVKMGKKDFCFITLGQVLKKEAAPAKFEQEYRIRVTEDYRLTGHGKYFSPVSHSAYRLRIRGRLDGNGILNLQVIHQSEDYDPETNPDGRYETNEQWKFNGEGIGWIGGDRPQALYMGIYYCD